LESITANSTEKSTSCSCVPTLSDALETIQKTAPAPENVLEAAQILLDKRLREFWYWDFFSHGDWIHGHIEYELGVIREGGPSPLFKLEGLMGLKRNVYVKKTQSCRSVIISTISRLYAVPMSQRPPCRWQCEYFVEDINRVSPLPHAICTIRADVDGTISDQNLTLHEMRAISRMIAEGSRGYHRRKYPTWPVSSNTIYLNQKLSTVASSTVLASLIHG
jgi:hypothetical protein